ncbi:MAG: aromatic ring-hydroxylating dioxygenase subunit alpha [Alphaproteobacteria bacterium]|nr:aromatic ring-hydroxylating dioxygenase subunit alpha [Alphaproteobacteria bacterium]
MRHEQQVHILEQLMQQLDECRNVDAGVQVRQPTIAYVDRQLAEREWRELFQNHAQLIGLSGDLPKANSYFTVDDFGVPVLATRDSQGRFRAYLNACRHRGVRLTKSNRGETQLFVCPFHAWSYSRDGALVAAPQEDQFGKLNKACHSLVSLPAEERHGLLFVHPRTDGVLNLDVQLGALNDEFAGWDFAHYLHCGDKTIDKRLNWKFANDTFGETYHFQKLHKATLGRIFHGDTLAYEVIGRNHRFVFPRRSILQMRDIPQEKWRLTTGATVVYYLFPNVQLVVNAGRVSLVRIYTLAGDPARSVTRIGSYFTQDMIDRVASAADDPDKILVDASNVYDSGDRAGAVLSLDALMEVFNSTIENEDYAMGEDQQRAAESGRLVHFLFGRNEAPLHHYHNAFRAALGEPPLEVVA